MTQDLRQQIVTAARELDRSGLNRGTSGNISVRDGGAMLITPSAVPSDRLTPDQIARMPLEGDYGSWEGPKKPSSEWRFHLDLLRARPEFGAIVHTHAPYSTILAIARKPIPAIHYMMAAFGGPEIRCSGYACYGTAELSAEVLAAMEGRNGCLMANHGMLVGAPTLARAMWLAARARGAGPPVCHVLQIGGGHVLTEADLAQTAQGFAGYGVS